MKKYHFIVLAIFLISAVFFSCNNEKPDNCKKIFSDNIVGRWKLNEVSWHVNNSKFDITDYSKENIIFDFQENNKLVVTGPIPNVLALFDDFQEGEHFYIFSSLNVPCGSDPPGENLVIDNKDTGMYCSPSLDEETMRIVGHKVIGGVIDEDGLITGDDTYGWEKKFIKVK